MRKDFKENLLNILNGVSTGVVIALVPGALVNELMKNIAHSGSGAQNILTMTSLMGSLLAVFAGLCVSYLLKFNLIQSGSLMAVAMIVSGAFQVKNGQIMLSGSGDVINIALTITLAAFLVKFLSKKLGSYTVLLLPLLVAVIAGEIGQFTLPYTQMVTGAVGQTIGTLPNFQPLVVGMLMGIAFAALIVSPISSVGIAMAIGVEGIVSGSANLGITACAFTWAIMSNGFGTTIAHFIGTPKIQMANMLKNPRLFLPVIASPGIAGLVGAIFEISGTANSAGFGSAGLIGPMAAYQEMAGGLLAIGFIMLLFAGMPIFLGFAMRYIFIQKLQFVRKEDLVIEDK
ncbi:PTS sugar transporter subunit IIC [Lactobacillus helveticus]|uniref:PTS sugar transporter subunit IIC n=1 Tax=Lactobacillus helveticus TaxID=1587 RepID=UPI001C6538B7|nr:PTS sugar transporter subunit IIC [Lactobacillus helveticus]MBW7986565.1 PTS sugar transporter subunit IIC [Lactobacillus helveticus]